MKGTLNSRLRFPVLYDRPQGVAVGEIFQNLAAVIEEHPSVGGFRDLVDQGLRPVLRAVEIVLVRIVCYSRGGADPQFSVLCRKDPEHFVVGN